MSKLNGDVLYLILKELNKIEKSLYTYLLVNKSWCEIIISTLWKNPWKYTKSYYEKKLLLEVIILHLPNETRNKLVMLGFDFSIILNKKPLFNYISFCKYLDLIAIECIISIAGAKIYEIDFFMNEIIRLFVNDENINITHLYIPNCQIHLIPEAKRCFSEIEFLSCNTKTSDSVLTGLTDMCQSIKELELIINMENNNHEIARLIESSKKLVSVSFLISYNRSAHDTLFYEVLENSLIKHANTIQHFKITKQPTTQILSYLINLRSLELASNFYSEKWHCLENLSIPFLQILRARRVSVKPLARLIENTSGYLTEFTIHNRGDNTLNNRIIIQAICKKCPNLKYLKLSLRSSNILELEKLLINCQYLEGLYILKTDAIDWGNLFKILAKSSPSSLFKFKFCFYCTEVKIESLKLFFDNWKDRHPMLLHFIQINQFGLEHKNLIEKYKEEGIVKSFVYNMYNEDFEWD